MLFCKYVLVESLQMDAGQRHAMMVLTVEILQETISALLMETITSHLLGTVGSICLFISVKS